MTSEWFVLCQQTRAASSLHLQLHRGFLLHSITGLWKISPSFEIFCEKTIYCSMMPPAHHALQHGSWDARGGRTTTQAAASAKHPNASSLWTPVCCYCHWHREGKRQQRGRWRLQGKRKGSFLLLQRGSSLPGDREEVVIAGTRTPSRTWMNSSGLPAWIRPGSPCSLLHFCQGHSLHLPLCLSPSPIITHGPEFWDTNVLTVFSVILHICTGEPESMTRCKGTHMACTSRIWTGSYRQDARQIAA